MVIAEAKHETKSDCLYQTEINRFSFTHQITNSPSEMKVRNLMKNVKKQRVNPSIMTAKQKGPPLLFQSFNQISDFHFNWGIGDLGNRGFGIHLLLG